VLAGGFSDEFDTQRVLARRQFLGYELLLGFDAEELVDVVKIAVLDEQRMTAEA
jgi:hypothetical protein